MLRIIDILHLPEDQDDTDQIPRSQIQGGIPDRRCWPTLSDQIPDPAKPHPGKRREIDQLSEHEHIRLHDDERRLQRRDTKSRRPREEEADREHHISQERDQEDSDPQG